MGIQEFVFLEAFRCFFCRIGGAFSVQRWMMSWIAAPIRHGNGEPNYVRNVNSFLMFCLLATILIPLTTHSQRVSGLAVPLTTDPPPDHEIPAAGPPHACRFLTMP